MVNAVAEPCPVVWVVMGISGVGKTTVGRCLAARLDCDFWEGDRRHPPANIDKMAAGIPLEDGDRRPWLLNLANDIRHALDHHRETVVTCSALKRAYRHQLDFSPRIQQVWLTLTSTAMEQHLEQRLNQRQNHYMGQDLLKTQLHACDPIEPDESVIQVDAGSSPDAVVAAILQQAQTRYAGLNRPWWQRDR